jgi:hypothetical protein
VERQLVSRVVRGLVNPIAPDHERGQGLDVGSVVPPAVLEMFRLQSGI